MFDIFKKFFGFGSRSKKMTAFPALVASSGATNDGLDIDGFFRNFGKVPRVDLTEGVPTNSGGHTSFILVPNRQERIVSVFPPSAFEEVTGEYKDELRSGLAELGWTLDET